MADAPPRVPVATNELLREIRSLRSRLMEAEQTIDAIRTGEVDALVVQDGDSERVFTLEGAERSYRIFVEQMQEGAVTLSLDGTILYCNKRFSDSVGARLEKAIGSSIFDFVPTGDQTTLRALVEGAQKQGIQGEVAFYSGGGNTVPCLVAIRCMEQGGTDLCMVVTDLTGQRRNEELVASEKLARSILDHAASAVVVCDNDGRIIRTNGEAAALSGRNPLYQTFHTAFPLALPTIETLHPLAAALGGHRVQGSEAILTREGEPSIDLLITAGPLRGNDGEILGGVVTLFDITERRASDRAVQESEERLRLIVDNAVEYAIIVMDTDRQIRDWSKGAEKLCGWPRAEALDLRGDVVFTDEERAARLPEREADLVARIGRVEEERWHVRRDGSRFWASGVMASLHHPDESLRGFLKVFHDATDRKEYEQSLEERVAERTSQLLAKNQELEGFTYSVSHDMRSPLRAMVARARILQEEEKGRISPDGEENLDRLVSAALKMAQLVDDLLQFARLGAREIHREKADLADLARFAAEAVAIERDDYPMSFTVHGTYPVECDPRLMGMVLHNLIDNACKYHRPGQGSNVEFGGERAGDEWVYFVRDDGIGFNMEYAGKLFLPFERLHRDEEYKGTGIGLANVKRVVERHGGRIWTESQPDRGATFFFTLPA